MRTFAIAVMILAASYSAWGQGAGAQSGDTARAARILLPETDFWLSRPTLFGPPPPLPDFARFELPPEFVTRDLAIPFTLSGGSFESRVDLMSPLLLQWKSEEKMRPFSIILGSLSAGAAAYVAYEHIRKYGLFK